VKNFDRYRVLKLRETYSGAAAKVENLDRVVPSYHLSLFLEKCSCDGVCFGANRSSVV
jgi:hypothetical protein